VGRSEATEAVACRTQKLIATGAEQSSHDASRVVVIATNRRLVEPQIAQAQPWLAKSVR